MISPPTKVFRFLVCLVLFFGVFIWGLPMGDAHILQEEEVRSKVYLTEDQALQKVFSDYDQVVVENKWLSRQQKKAIQQSTGMAVQKKRLKFYVGVKNGNKKHWALFDEISQPAHHPIKIHYMVVFENDGRVREVRILEFLGLQRTEIVSDSFLKQFQGLSMDTGFSTVQSRQGKTASVQALVQGVHQLAAVYNAVYKNP